MADIIVQNAIGKVTEAINSGASGNQNYQSFWKIPS